MFRRFGQLFSKKLQKVAHFVKKDEKSKNFGEMLQLLEQTIMFWSTFQQKVAKSGSFREKARKSIDLARSCNFSSKLACFVVFVHFSAKVAKSGSFREKARKIIDLAKTCNFSRKLPCFGVLVNFSAKGGSFREKAREIIDLAKTRKFSSKLPCLGFLSTFQQKASKSGSFREKG